MDIVKQLELEFSLKPWQAENTVKLIDDGNTIPFIARYRKEATGSLDDQLLRELNDRLNYLRSLEEQKEKIIASITEQEKMTDDIAKSIENAKTMTELEDIYRPFRPKRKTRASVAKALGLEPLAEAIYAQEKGTPAPEILAEDYLTDEVADIESALQGAKDIIAEFVSDDPNGRKLIRYAVHNNGMLTSKGADDDLGVYEMYKEYSEPVKSIAGHRVLAVNRGEKEGKLKVAIEFDKTIATDLLFNIHCKNNTKATDLVIEAVEDSFNRLIFPSIEREIRNELTANACEASIKVFGENTRQLLMQPPVKGNVTIGLDPGYRTGCKVAVISETGKVLDTGVIYPAPPHNKIEEAKKTITALVKKYNVKMFAIGNGTASHETEVFASDLIKELDCGITYMVVSEAGASVYSASKLAAEEFPQFDVSLRSAVSIARRLQDPLAELVKIDPKAIGVGQYQHDMPQKELSAELDGVVESCVNSVGVDLNTASPQLLSRVAGVSSAVAKNIVAYREENGSFTSRSELKKVSKLGPKAFEQCAGFLRVAESKNVLDNTAVHPESYSAAKELLKVCEVSESDIKSGNITKLQSQVQTIGTSALAQKLDIGEPTLVDIVSELSKPGRDPRDELPKPLLRTDVMGMEDLKAGMELNGTVRNVIDFGAFVDIGVHQDGLVHISQITNRYIKHPSDVLKVGDIVTVWVLSVDVDKKRISLTMKNPNEKKDKK
ncbi:MAG: Tex family protein [Eubacterium coprostanoligenes]|uniref:Tex family protein n=1 Tax=Eubacterium coprostanoligenes TaxID=290054 RepID=UPI0024098BF2|nr:Tex family protein [Eubacterium coprostanoligenes]MDD6666319.1 Tex family protein [Eubacterium coprostanoligenes]